MKITGCTEGEIDGVWMLYDWEAKEMPGGLSGLSKSEIASIARQAYNEYKSMTDEEKQKIKDMVPEMEKYAVNPEDLDEVVQEAVNRLERVGVELLEAYVNSRRNTANVYFTRADGQEFVIDFLWGKLKTVPEGEVVYEVPGVDGDPGKILESNNLNVLVNKAKEYGDYQTTMQFKKEL